MKNVQIPYDLFVALLQYHLMMDDDYADEIRYGLEQKLEAILDILGSIKKCQKNIYILHWFTGSLHQMKIALELGCFFSINPKMLKTKSGIDLIQNIPPQRILLETDAPFSANFKNIKQLNTILQRLINDISVLKKVDIGKNITYNEKTIFKYI